MTTASKFETEPMSGSLGLQITGLDLRSGLDHETVAELSMPFA